MSDDPAVLQEALAALYRFEHMLGRGGMATVYRAHDLRHDRPVAFKVLRRELSAALGLDRRFGREIAITARLAHPNILGVIDSGSVDGPGGRLHYYVMPFVAGDSLRERLAGGTQLPLDEALGLAAEVADALAHAHERGVVHRDIKPGNILIQEGHALVADFGIAELAAGVGDDTVTTSAGLVLGTPTYMSPEQSEGADLDGRADVYSLGCVLYEMLAGEPPFSGATVQAMAARHRLDPPPSLRTSRPDLPGEVDVLIHRALAKRPADRWKGAAAFRDAIRRLPTELAASTGRREAVRASTRGRWFLALAAVLAVVAAIALLRGPAAAPAPATLPTVILDGFTDETGGSLRAEANALRDGLLQELQGTRAIQVRLGSVAADTADATWGIVAAVDRLGDSLVASARLLDLRTREELQVARAAATDPMALRTAVASGPRSVHATLRAALSGALTTERWRRQVRDSATWDLAQRGYTTLQAVDEPAVMTAGPSWALRELARGDSLLEAAVRRRPGAAALRVMHLSAAALAPVLAEFSAQVFPDSASLGDPEALRAGVIAEAGRAVAEFPEDAELRALHGALLAEQFRLTRAAADFDTARMELEQAIALDPDRAEAWLALAGMHLEAGQFGEALTAARRGREVDDFDVHEVALLRMVFESELRLERWPAAAETCAEGAAAHPDHFAFMTCREEIAFRTSDDPAEAARTLAHADSLEATRASYATFLVPQLRLTAAAVFARAGRPAESDAAYRLATRDWAAPGSAPPPYLLDAAYTMAVRGRSDSALALIARAVRESPVLAGVVERMPWYASLRDDPRYLPALRGTDPAEVSSP